MAGYDALMDAMRTLDPWRSRTTRAKGRRRPRRPIEAPRVVEAIDRGVYDLLAREYPELWDDLSEVGRDILIRGLMQAGGQPPEDRDQAVADVIETWLEAQEQLYVALDDEPYTEDEQAEDAAAIERLQRGEGVPLDDIAPRGKRSR